MNAGASPEKKTSPGSALWVRAAVTAPCRAQWELPGATAATSWCKTGAGHGIWSSLIRTLQQSRPGHVAPFPAQASPPLSLWLREYLTIIIFKWGSFGQREWMHPCGHVGKLRHLLWLQTAALLSAYCCHPPQTLIGRVLHFFPPFFFLLFSNELFSPLISNFPRNLRQSKSF